MESKEPITLSDEQKKQLQQEEFISEVVRIRAEHDQTTKNSWLKFLGTTGGAALITVLVGGLLGTVLNSCIQAGLKSREVEQARQKSKSEIGIISFKDHLDRRQETVKSLYSLVGRCAAASHSLLSTTLIDTNQYSDKAVQKLVEEDNEQVHKNFQAIQAEWLSNRDSLGLLVSYYFEGNMSVTSGWKETKDSVTRYLDCADAEYKNYLEFFVKRPELRCKEERNSVEITTEAFAQYVKSATYYPWKDYYPEYSSPAPQSSATP